jgi:hypothetical protein
MKKKLFTQCLNAIEMQYKHNDKMAAVANQFFPDAYQANLIYDTHWIMNAMVEVLQDALDDANEHSWIEYFIHELDFGRKFKIGMVKVYDIEIDLSDAGKLYDFLIAEKKRHLDCAR